VEQPEDPIVDLKPGVQISLTLTLTDVCVFVRDVLKEYARKTDKNMALRAPSKSAMENAVFDEISGWLNANMVGLDVQSVDVVPSSECPLPDLLAHSEATPQDLRRFLSACSIGLTLSPSVDELEQRRDHDKFITQEARALLKKLKTRKN